MDTANLILRELHEAVIEREQRELTIVGTIFAAASVASLVLAAVTLFFTQTQWEVTSGRIATVLLIGKLALVTYLITLPWALLVVARKWAPHVLQVVGDVADEESASGRSRVRRRPRGSRIFRPTRPR